MSDRILRANEVARRLGVTVDTLARWRRTGQGPRWQRIGCRVVGYSAMALEVWLEGQRQAMEAEPGSENA
uniref:Putative DNA binding, helix-turn-helix domain containing protein n=1 Tax=viral metagenome TaxID=1070528 RepID=A0A6M3M9V5_9ZZZZ